MATSPRSRPVTMNQLTFLSEAPLANPSRSLDLEQAWLTRVATSCSGLVRLLTDFAPAGSFGKMSPESCHQTADGILAPSSGCWQSSGMGSPTEFLTLSTSEWTALPEQFPSDDGVCSLSDILETGGVPQRYFLSAKACRGILRRAEKRGKDLPRQLLQALQQAAEV